MENIIEKVRKFVEEECNKHSFGNQIFIHHFIPVVNYAKELVKKLGGDLEVIEIAAWLHDIGSIVYNRKDHHITGAKIAVEKLREFGYSEEKIELVKRCIFNHRGSVGNDLESVEEKIIAEADCMAFFDNLEGYFLWTIDVDNIKNQKLIRKSIKQKTLNKWKQLSLESKDLIRLKFEATMLLFGED
jgi:uncharacterized protein